MNVNGRDIGDALDGLYEEISNRVSEEAARELQIDKFDGDSFSRVRWSNDTPSVLIFVHEQLPTHAIPHVLGVALQHVRQRLDRYPDIRRPSGRQAAEGAGPLRTMLRELVMAPEAEAQLADLGLDSEWETEQRHEAMKQILRAPPSDWKRDGTLGNKFAALQYARFELEHPSAMWKSLRDDMEDSLPIAAERGKRAVASVREHGWDSPDACLQSLLGVRDSMGMEYIAWIVDRRNGEII
ncbi:MAG: hypothetical protein F4056_00930 [Chloroflexi bacterium]|nr:hypothetical protein [Chloroflexota bacterium]